MIGLRTEDVAGATPKKRHFPFSAIWRSGMLFRFSDLDR
jgi:hypothetical protein